MHYTSAISSRKKIIRLLFVNKELELLTFKPKKLSNEDENYTLYSIAENELLSTDIYHCLNSIFILWNLSAELFPNLLESNLVLNKDNNFEKHQVVLIFAEDTDIIASEIRTQDTKWIKLNSIYSSGIEESLYSNIFHLLLLAQSKRKINAFFNILNMSLNLKTLKSLQPYI